MKQPFEVLLVDLFHSKQDSMMTKKKQLETAVQENAWIVVTAPNEEIALKTEPTNVKPISDFVSEFSETAMVPPVVASRTIGLAIANNLNSKADAQKVLKELPMNDFLNFLEQSSPEQLELFLKQIAPSKQPLAQSLRSLFNILVNIPDEPRGSFSIIGWWEARRALFNIIVLLCGLPTLFVIYFSGLASLKFAVTGAIEYAILANLCYTAGWICELIARSWWKERARHLGPILLSLGLSFSTLFTMGAGFVMVILFLLLSLFRGG